jgi:hypothetical protein
VIRLDCRACAAPLDVGVRHRGRAVRCPLCGAELEVPRNLDFRGARTASAEDRKAGKAALSWALLGVFCIGPPVTAAVWWWSSRRIARAADEGRIPPESLLGARVVAATALIGQVAALASIVPYL